MITVEQIKELRNATGAGVNAIREALEASQGNTEAAIKYLREKGVAKGEKRKDKVANNGILGTYIHGNSRMAVIVEVACETDFAAKSEDMKKFAQDLALHIAAVNPQFVNVEAVDRDVLDTEIKAAEQGIENKPEEIKKNIIDGRLQKFYKETVLLKQNLFTDENKTVEDYLNEMVTKIGEKIQITRFYRIEVAGNTIVSVI